MIEENYVSFETAKLLKERGFDEYTISYYDKNGSIGFSEVDTRVSDGYQRPTLQMAMKWLREVHKLQVSPRYDEVEDEKERLHYVWFFDILSMNPYKMLFESEQGYNTYEEACEAAIKYCLEKNV